MTKPRKEHMAMIRMSPEDWDLATRLATEKSELTGMKITRSAIVRMALRALEREGEDEDHVCPKLDEDGKPCGRGEGHEVICYP